jgi:hypothetical protein
MPYNRTRSASPGKSQYIIHRPRAYHWVYDGDSIVREMTPYGVYHRTNGDEVLFSRTYMPLFHYQVGCGDVALLEPGWWCPDIEYQTYFYDDSRLPWYDEEMYKLMQHVVKQWMNAEPVLPQDVLNSYYKLYSDGRSEVITL